MSKIKFTIISLFPEALKPYLDSSMLYKAQKEGIIEVEYVNLRDFGLGAHKSVDDTPYGGGDGMLLRCEPAYAAIESVKSGSPQAKVILPTPVGEIWDQNLARRFAGVEDNSFSESEVAGKESSCFSWRRRLKGEDIIPLEAPATNGEQPEQGAPVMTGRDAVSCKKSKNRSAHYIIFCPHYEGYDERIMNLVDYPISLGQYVLTGGELPALIIVDSITRLLPGVLGGETSAQIESFSDGANFEYPQYTKPAEFRGMAVPKVLLSGHHAKIAEWREEQSRLRSQK